MPPPPFRPLSTLPDYRPVRMSRDFLAPWITHQPQLQVTLLSRMQRVKSWSELKYTECNKSWKIFSGQNEPLQILSGELNCNYLRSWISAWRDRRRAKWPVTLWRAGTEHQRSYSTGCTTVRQVTILPSLMQTVFRDQFVMNTTEYCGIMTKYYIFIIEILSVSPSRLTVDVWSAACILAEMITGSVLFPGHDSILALCCNKNCVCSISVARSSHCARLVSCLKYRTCWCRMVRHEGALHRFYPSWWVAYYSDHSCEISSVALEGVLVLNLISGLTSLQTACVKKFTQNWNSVLTKPPPCRGRSAEVQAREKTFLDLCSKTRLQLFSKQLK